MHTAYHSCMMNAAAAGLNSGSRENAELLLIDEVVCSVFLSAALRSADLGTCMHRTAESSLEVVGTDDSW